MLDIILGGLGVIAICLLFAGVLAYSDYEKARKEHKRFLKVLFSEDE